jgi:hypothetical protein
MLKFVVDGLREAATKAGDSIASTRVAGYLFNSEFNTTGVNASNVSSATFPDIFLAAGSRFSMADTTSIRVYKFLRNGTFKVIGNIGSRDISPTIEDTNITHTIDAINAVDIWLDDNELFEFGKVYLPSYEVLPKETLNFAGIKAKLSGNETNTFYELKQILDVLFSTLKIANQVEFLPILTENLPNYVHPTKSAKILINGKNIGIIATLHPQFLPVKNSHLVFFEINIEDLFSIIQDTKIVYQPISSYPSIYRDLSIVLDYKILISEIEKLAKFQAPNLKNIELFDEYQDSEKLGKNLKNLAFHLEFQSMTGTLEEGVVEAEFTAIVQVLNSELSAQLRLNFDQTKNN